MGALAVIVARGGSKRIPRKNIKEFCGRPIIFYSIQAALEAGCFDEVMVSTDDEKIKEIAEQFGARVPFMRSEKTSNDYATTAEVLLEVLAEYQYRKKEFQTICCIYPTAPFITGQKLKSAMQLLDRENVDSVIAVVPFSYPPQRGFLLRDDKLLYQYPEYESARSQDLENIYHDAGQFYCMKASRFKESKHIVMENTVPYQVGELEVQDIDNFVDWELAEIKYKRMEMKIL